jgi:phosphonate transport system substrate-binding protein
MHRVPTLVLTVAVAVSGCERSRYREVEVNLDAPPSSPARRAEGAAHPLRVSVAAVESPRGTYAGYSRLFTLLGDRVGLPIEFVQRRTYREVNDLLAAGKLDAALLCTGGLLDLQRRAHGAVEVLAVPLVGGRPTYESIVLVPAASSARSVADLAGKRFAFTDELSFSGHLYLARLVRDMGQDPERFFGSIIFTHSHDRSIVAAARGLVDGAAVHGGIYANMIRNDPALGQQLRVIHRSPPFGAMPVVASTALAPAARAQLQEALLSLSAQPEGAAALALIGVDGFVPAPPGLYGSAARVIEAGP